jgi:hypothetical protein
MLSISWLVYVLVHQLVVVDRGHIMAQTRISAAHPPSCLAPEFKLIAMSLTASLRA